MNQEKIGKFIAECRKKDKMTQKELASHLGVSEKTISNWENGRNMPDLSLFKPLCNELNITINDLMSGEKVKENEYQDKFEENILATINNNIIKKNRILKLIIIFIVILAVSNITYICYENIRLKDNIESYPIITKFSETYMNAKTDTYLDNYLKEEYHSAGFTIRYLYELGELDNTGNRSKRIVEKSFYLCNVYKIWTINDY